MVVDGNPCVRLLNLSGKIGCSNPGRGKVVAPIMRFRNANELTQSTSILVSLDEVEDLFLKISNDKFPQAELAPYLSINYEWNPTGSGILQKAYDFPVFLLSESNTLTLQEVAMKNEKAKNAYITSVAEFDLVMQTTKVGAHNFVSCLKEQACLPLGGYRAVFGHRSHQSISHCHTNRSPLYY